jgi:hypothetical protein
MPCAQETLFLGRYEEACGVTIFNTADSQIVSILFFELNYDENQARLFCNKKVLQIYRTGRRERGADRSRIRHSIRELISLHTSPHEIFFRVANFFPAFLSIDGIFNNCIMDTLLVRRSAESSHRICSATTWTIIWFGASTMAQFYFLLMIGSLGRNNGVFVSSKLSPHQAMKCLQVWLMGSRQRQS